MKTIAHRRERALRRQVRATVAPLLGSGEKMLGWFMAEPPGELVIWAGGDHIAASAAHKRMLSRYGAGRTEIRMRAVWALTDRMIVQLSGATHGQVGSEVAVIDLASVLRIERSTETFRTGAIRAAAGAVVMAEDELITFDIPPYSLRSFDRFCEQFQRVAPRDRLPVEPVTTRDPGTMAVATSAPAPDPEVLDLRDLPAAPEPDWQAHEGQPNWQAHEAIARHGSFAAAGIGAGSSPSTPSSASSSSSYGDSEAAAAEEPAAPAGWYPDPNIGAFRWWDGTAWTEHTG